MSKGRRPKNKHEVTIYFDTKLGIENFMAWYSNSGEQQSGYYEKSYGKDWMYVKPPDDACPKCEFADDDINSFFWKNKVIPGHTWTCTNCNHQYIVTNPFEDET